MNRRELCSYRDIPRKITDRKYKFIVEEFVKSIAEFADASFGDTSSEQQPPFLYEEAVTETGTSVRGTRIVDQQLNGEQASAMLVVEFLSVGYRLARFRASKGAYIHGDGISIGPIPVSRKLFTGSMPNEEIREIASQYREDLLYSASDFDDLFDELRRRLDQP